MAHPDSAESHVDDGDEVLDADELDAAAIAAAMGFSSFGSQAHPNKKRRFNPRADAVVADDGGRSATGSNAVPLAHAASASVTGRRPPALSSLPLHPQSLTGAGASGAVEISKTNGDEIGLDADDADADYGEQEREPQYVDTSRPVGEVRRLGEVVKEGDDAADGAGQPEEEEDAAAMQARIDAILAAGNATYGMAMATGTAAATVTAAAIVTPDNQLDGSVVSAAQHHNAAGQRIVRAMDRHGFRADLAAGPPHAAAAEDGSGSHGTHGGYGRNGGQPPLWTDYYDPTSNENPWAQLEESLGVPARGSWLARQGAQHRGPGPAAAAATAAAAAPL